MQKGVIAVVLISALMVLVTSAVLAGNTSESGIKHLRIGYQPSTHQIAEMTAMEKGWWESELKRFGVEKVTDYEFGSGPPEMTAMMAGDLDIAYVGATPPIAAIDKGLDAKIVAGVQINGSALVLRPELADKYKGPDDLRGLKIATFPPGSIQDTILRKWLIDNGIDPDKDLEIVAMGPGDAITAIAAKAVDGVFLPSPSPTIIELAGNGKIVVHSGEMWPNHACCCLLVSGDLIRNHPELVEQIIRIHINATEYNKEHLDEAAEIFAKRVGWDVSDVKYSFEKWDGRWVHDPYIGMDCTLEFAKTLYDLGYTKKLLKKEDLFDTSFYDRVVGRAPTPSPTPSPTPMVKPPGFEAVLSAATLLVVAYLIMRRK